VLRRSGLLTRTHTATVMRESQIRLGHPELPERVSMRSATLLAGFIIIFGVGYPAYAQETHVPEDTRGFMKWCSERGFNFKDSVGWSCSFTISVSAKAAAGGRSPSCRALYDRLGPYGEKGPEAVQVAQSIYSWLVANQSRLPGRFDDAIRAAILNLYQCDGR
jgi:hypothetical protein